jgi:hypothetical protein
MATGSRKRRGATRARADNSGRVPYRFTADQVLSMVEAGIIQHVTRRPGDLLEVVIGGESRGQLAVSDLFPPAP